MAIMRQVFAGMFVMLAFAGCAVSSDDNSEPATSDPAVTSTDQDVTVPPELQMVEPRAACAFSCVSRNLCVANDGVIKTGTCATGQVCCSFNQCVNAGDSCVSRNLCTANGGHTVSHPGCATGQVCCAF